MQQRAIKSRKFDYVSVLQANYGCGDGWEDIGEGTHREMREEKLTYMKNAPEYRYRIVSRRVLREVA